MFMCKMRSSGVLGQQMQEYSKKSGKDTEICHLLPENDALQVERVFYDPSGWDSNPKNVLLGR